MATNVPTLLAGSDSVLAVGIAVAIVLSAYTLYRQRTMIEPRLGTFELAAEPTGTFTPATAAIERSRNQRADGGNVRSNDEQTKNGTSPNANRTSP
ncbi:MAG: hypothetical protein ACQETB_07575, partial [Halobacteriota archaeon]